METKPLETTARPISNGVENTTAPAPAPVALTTHKQPKFVRWAVMLGIVVALNIFFFVATSLLFPQVKYEDFCPVNQPSPATESSCTTMGGVWNPTVDSGAVPANPTGGSLTPYTYPTGYCDFTTKCQKPYEAASADRQMKVFVLMVGFGVLSIIVGVLPLGSSIVSTGLSYGGVLALVLGAAQYWSEAGNFLKLGISGIALLALIFIGLKRFRD